MLKETAGMVKEAAHSAPPAVYVAAGLFGYTWSELSAAAIFVFTLIQIIRALIKMAFCIKCYISHWSCDRSCKELK